MNDIWMIILSVFFAGCLGGITNAAIADELKLPHRDPEAQIYRPGWIGNILVGGVAALVLWGLYGPMANAILIGSIPTSSPAPILHVAEFFAGIVTGIGGGRVLSSEVDKRLLEGKNKSLTVAKDKLAEAVSTLAQEI